MIFIVPDGVCLIINGVSPPAEDVHGITKALGKLFHKGDTLSLRFGIGFCGTDDRQHFCFVWNRHVADFIQAGKAAAVFRRCCIDAIMPVEARVFLKKSMLGAIMHAKGRDDQSELPQIGSRVRFDLWRLGDEQYSPGARDARQGLGRRFIKDGKPCAAVQTGIDAEGTAVQFPHAVTCLPKPRPRDMHRQEVTRKR